MTYANPAGRVTYANPAGQVTYANPAGRVTYANPAGQVTYANPAGRRDRARVAGPSPPGAVVRPSRVSIAYMRNGRAAVCSHGNAAACGSVTRALGSVASGAGGVRVTPYPLKPWEPTTYT